MGVKQRPRCFFDIAINRIPAGRIVFELFSDVCPKTCENFRCLCTGERGIGKITRKPLHFRSTAFHRIVKNFMVQGGDFSEGNGRGGESIYGGFFEDENFQLKHDQEFLLSMANRGKDTNGSQFFITTKPAPHLDGEHVVFGRVLSGQDLLKEIENQKTDANSLPYADIRVVHCGEVSEQLRGENDVLRAGSCGRRSSRSASSRSSSESEAKPRRGGTGVTGAMRKRKVVDEDVACRGSDPKRSRPARWASRRSSTGSSSSRSSEEDQSSPRRPRRTVQHDQIPAVPQNSFLLRGNSKPKSSDALPGRGNAMQYQPAISKSGRKIKGRGTMRYRTPSGSRSESEAAGREVESWRSETPPHWREEMNKTRNTAQAPSSQDRWAKGDKLAEYERRDEHRSPSPWSHEGYMEEHGQIEHKKKKTKRAKQKKKKKRKKDSEKEKSPAKSVNPPSSRSSLRSDSVDLNRKKISQKPFLQSTADSKVFKKSSNTAGKTPSDRSRDVSSSQSPSTSLSPPSRRSSSRSSSRLWSRRRSYSTSRSISRSPSRSQSSTRLRRFHSSHGRFVRPHRRSRSSSGSRSYSRPRSRSRSRRQSYSRRRSRGRSYSSRGRSSSSSRSRSGSRVRVAPSVARPPAPQNPVAVKAAEIARVLAPVLIPVDESAAPLPPMSDSPPPSRWKPGQKPWKPSYLNTNESHGSVVDFTAIIRHPPLAIAVDKEPVTQALQNPSDVVDSLTGLDGTALTEEAQGTKRKHSPVSVKTTSRSRTGSRSSSVSMRKELRVSSRSRTRSASRSDARASSKSPSHSWSPHYKAHSLSSTASSQMSRRVAARAESTEPQRPAVSGTKGPPLSEGELSYLSSRQSDVNSVSSGAACLKRRKKPRGLRKKKSKKKKSHRKKQQKATDEREGSSASADSAQAELYSSRSNGDKISRVRSFQRPVSNTEKDKARDGHSKKYGDKKKRKKKAPEKPKGTFHWQPPLEYEEEEEDAEEARGDSLVAAGGPSNKQTPGEVRADDMVTKQVSCCVGSGAVGAAAVATVNSTDVHVGSGGDVSPRRVGATAPVEELGEIVLEKCSASTPPIDEAVEEFEKLNRNGASAHPEKCDVDAADELTELNIPTPNKEDATDLSPLRDITEPLADSCLSISVDDVLTKSSDQHRSISLCTKTMPEPGCALASEDLSALLVTLDTEGAGENASSPHLEPRRGSRDLRDTPCKSVTEQPQAIMGGHLRTAVMTEEPPAETASRLDEREEDAMSLDEDESVSMVEVHVPASQVEGVKVDPESPSPTFFGDSDTVLEKRAVTSAILSDKWKPVKETQMAFSLTTARAERENRKTRASIVADRKVLPSGRASVGNLKWKPVEGPKIYISPKLAVANLPTHSSSAGVNEEAECQSDKAVGMGRHPAWVGVESVPGNQEVEPGREKVYTRESSQRESSKVLDMIKKKAVKPGSLFDELSKTMKQRRHQRRRAKLNDSSSEREGDDYNDQDGGGGGGGGGGSGAGGSVGGRSCKRDGRKRRSSRPGSRQRPRRPGQDSASRDSSRSRRASRSSRSSSSGSRSRSPSRSRTRSSHGSARRHTGSGRRHARSRRSWSRARTWRSSSSERSYRRRRRSYSWHSRSRSRSRSHSRRSHSRGSYSSHGSYRSASRGRSRRSSTSYSDQSRSRTRSRSRSHQTSSRSSSGSRHGSYSGSASVSSRYS